MSGKTIGDHMGRLAQRIRLPWWYSDVHDIACTKGPSHIHACLSSVALTLTVEVDPIEGEPLDALCDRARAAVVELLEAMPERQEGA